MEEEFPAVKEESAEGQVLGDVLQGPPCLLMGLSGGTPARQKLKQRLGAS